LTKRACSLAVLAALALPAAAAASSTQESTFADDDLLVRGSPAVQAQTLDAMKALGADRVRVSLIWRLVAPAAADAQKPAGFDGANPAAYPAGAWDRYDRLVQLAAQRGLGIAFDVTAPAPNWATGTPSEQPQIDPIFNPSVAEFGAFVRAAALRYRSVHYWSIWNEPNDAGSLTPQWLPDPRDPTRWVPASPQLYRLLVDAGWQALQETGHGRDTILIGETAPKGLLDNAGLTASIDSQLFIRELYCVDANLQAYQGTSAEVRGCPTDGVPATLVREHPALFAATGWAHHPYELSIAPNDPPRHEDSWLTLGNLGDLSRLLRRIRARYAQPAQALSRLYLTEYGYQTNPPEAQGVSPALQADYLNHAEYLTWRNQTVRTLGQFPLKDGTPVASTFQSGLRTVKGARKPAYDAYALPVWLPSPRVKTGGRLKVWGLVRAAPNNKRAKVSIQVRRRGSRAWTRMATRSTQGPRGYLTANVRVESSGDLRLVWNGHHSRAASFTVR
jgi:hypothetical protein